VTGTFSWYYGMQSASCYFILLFLIIFNIYYIYKGKQLLKLLTAGPQPT